MTTKAVPARIVNAAGERVELHETDEEPSEDEGPCMGPRTLGAGSRCAHGFAVPHDPRTDHRDDK